MSYRDLTEGAPYYDDFAASKNFLRLVFNPARAVQARELSQLQTILANQIGDFASHIFRDGTAIQGGAISVSFNQPAMTAAAQTVGGFPVELENFVGRTIVGLTSGQEAVVTAVDTDTRAVYFQYKGGLFTDGEDFEATTIPRHELTMEAGSQRFVTYAKCTDGVAYAAGSFVQVNKQESHVTDEKTGRFYIGFRFVDDIVTIAEDSSLGDPAQGEPNENASGADRYRARLILDSYKEGDPISDTFKESFFTIITIQDDRVISDINDTQYSQLLDLLAERTFDQAGNYTIFPWYATPQINTEDDTKLSLDITSGRGYIRGYRVETIDTTTIPIDKARTTQQISNLNLYTGEGIYIRAKLNETGEIAASGVIQVAENEVVEFMSGENGTGTVLGECRVQSLYRSGNIVRYYLSEVQNVLSHLTSAQSFRSKQTPATYVNTIVGSVSGQQKPNIYETNSEFISTFSSNSVEFDYVRQFNNITASNGVVTVVAPENTIDFFGTDGVLFVYDRTSATTRPIGGISAIPNNTTSPSTVAITIPNVANHVVDLTLRVKRKTSNARSKILTSTQETFTLSGTTDSFQLTNEDVYDILTIEQTSNIKANADVADIKDVITLDNGQRDYYYERGNVSGFTGTGANATKDSTSASTTYTITYRYFQHSSTGQYFTVDSYTTANNIGIIPNIYEDIYSYGNINLRDSIDFRAKKSEIANVDVSLYYTSLIEASINVYLGRVDWLYIDETGNFGIKSGIPSLSPEEPTQVNNAMSFYRMELRPYTRDTSSIRLRFIDNRRYTMEDIGDIDSKVEALADLTSLNLLEVDAREQKITDAAGLDRFKTGIFVDAFTDLESTADFQNSIYRANNDFYAKELIAPFTKQHVNFVQSVSESTGVNFGTEYALLPSTPVELISQPFATDAISVQPYENFYWDGTLSVTPSVDTWSDVVNTVTSEQFVDIPKPRKSVSTSVRRRGNTERTTTRTTSSVPKTTTSKQLTYQEIVQDEFMRQRSVTFTGRGFRPSTPHRLRFDNTQIPNVTYSTDNVGNVNGTFTVPANVPVGRVSISLEDDELTSTGRTEYEAYGQTTYRDYSVTHTRGWEARTTTTTRTRRYDPVAQGFRIELDGGAFVESVDLYFRQKDATVPVSVYLVEMENGIPTTNELPAARSTVDSADVTISSDGTAATTFRFPDPVYLNDNREYAFVVFSPSFLYQVYFAELGQFDLATNQLVASQPYSSSLFLSQNRSTWTPDQLKTVKFNMKRCMFDTTTNGTIIANSESVPERFGVSRSANLVSFVEFPNTQVSTAQRFFGDLQYVEFENSTFVNHLTEKFYDPANDPDASSKFRVIMSTNRDNLSPIVDLHQMFTLGISNDTVSLPNNRLNAGTYVSNQINLENASDDIRVFLDSVIPTGSDVEVFFRTEAYRPNFVTQSTTSTLGTGDVTSLVGKENNVYYYDSDSTIEGNVTDAGSCIVTGYDSTDRKLFIRSVSDTTIFRTASGDGDIPDPYPSTNANHILVTDEEGITRIRPYNTGTSFATDDYCTHGGFVWKRASGSGTNAPTPTVLGTEWTQIITCRTISSIQQDNEVEWRRMRRNSDFGDSVDPATQFVEYEYVPEIELDSNFLSFTIRVDYITTDRVNVPRSRNLRAISVF